MIRYQNQRTRRGQVHRSESGILNLKRQQTLKSNMKKGTNNVLSGIGSVMDTMPTDGLNKAIARQQASKK
ncbi:hypothetical protein [Nitrosomonas halophila]|uniref:Uncharacterized protein n=1 Tax=Nitrosomonas halophila TaxID=44576 RepID=A0A1H3PU80_9PROT|nr:hypothetical protein [Nitrosomonas halophila]SDZ04395.1 hypothetical protein SAMN05421881_11121 [Nitrosomonas halophila]